MSFTFDRTFSSIPGPLQIHNQKLVPFSSVGIKVFTSKRKSTENILNKFLHIVMHTHNQYIHVSYLEDDALGAESVSSYVNKPRRSVSERRHSWLSPSVRRSSGVSVPRIATNTVRNLRKTTTKYAASPLTFTAKNRQKRKWEGGEASFHFIKSAQKKPQASWNTLPQTNHLIEI